MSTETTPGRRQIRAAVQIHTHLIGTGRFGPIPILYDDEWGQLTKIAERFEMAREKGWRTAADSLLSELDLSAANLVRRLDRFRHELPRVPAPMQVSAPRDIAADLAAVVEEFEEVELNLQEKSLSVLTSPIELEDTFLGPFRIVLNWEEIGKGPCYEVVAEDPNPAAGNDHVTHPHVSSETLCEGQGSTAIRKALAQGRFLDFFTLVKQILETYNADSAYVALSRWNGGTDCYDCGESVSDEYSWCCSRCSETVCDNCRSSCEACDETLCGGCCASCQECREVFCRGCLEFRPGSRVLVCNDCLEKGNKSDDDETPASPAAEQPDEGSPCSAASPPDPLCLEEALVPA
jgi:hypothetical protein